MLPPVAHKIWLAFSILSARAFASRYSFAEETSAGPVKEAQEEGSI